MYSLQMDWYSIYKRNATEKNELHMKNGYDYLSKDQYNNMIKELLDDLKLNKTSKILDAGCGAGAFSKVVKSYGTTDIYGVDFVQELVEFAKKEIPEGTFYHKSIDDLSIFEDNTFDYVLSNGVFLYLTLENAKKALQEFKRVVKPNGIVFIGDINDYEKKHIYNNLRKTTHKKSPDHLHLKKSFFNIDQLQVQKIVDYENTGFKDLVITSSYRYGIYLKKIP